MKVLMRKVAIQTKGGMEMVNITREVKGMVEGSGIGNGVAIVFTLHTTTGLTLNEDEPGLEKDIPSALRRIVPDEGPYHHHHFHAKDGRMAVNAWAHIRGSLLGANIIIPVAEGHMQLGPRQNIYFVEFDGPQEREFIIQVIGE